MELTVKDRILIPTLLPKQGKMVEMLLVRSIIKKIDFTPEEIKEFELRDAPTGGVAYSLEKSKSIEVDFTDGEVDVLKKGVESINEQAVITLEMVDTCSKIQEL